MKKFELFCVVILLIAAIFTGCTPSENTETIPTEPPIAAETGEPSTEDVTEEPTEAPTGAATEAATGNDGEGFAYADETTVHYIDVAYAEQIRRYHTALSEKWNTEKYIDNGMSEVPAAYYEGTPLSNVGFGFEDLDYDGQWELIIGAIQNAEEAPAVFEIWTLVDDKPVMLAQSSTTNQYALQYVEEDNMWYVANECTNSTLNSGCYYLMLIDGKLEIMQGILYDSEADAENPWFMTYDMDWDTSNDDPIDEEMANAILENNRSHYTAIEYFPYILLK